MNDRTTRRTWLPVSSACLGAAVLTFLLILPSGSQEISWSIPADGGTPRDTNRIERVGPREFRIRSSFEEGGQSVLRHAVSRVDLVVRNDGSQLASVTRTVQKMRHRPARAQRFGGHRVLSRFAMVVNILLTPRH